MTDNCERKLPTSLQLTGRVALVTGGSRGIGRAICLTLAERGAAVAVNFASREDAALEVSKEINDAGGRAIAVGFDVSDSKAVDAGIASIAKELGGLHIVVNNAGISIDSLLMRASEGDWQKTMDINLKGAFLVAKAATRHLLKARDQGRLINISSVIGEQGNAGQAVYSASKAGLIGLTKSLAYELAPRGVTVNAITPGFIETDMTADGLHGDARDALIKRIPLGRVAAPSEVAEAVAYLASPAAGYVTGHVMRINGGLLI